MAVRLITTFCGAATDGDADGVADVLAGWLRWCDPPGRAMSLAAVLLAECGFDELTT